MFFLLRAMRRLFGFDQSSAETFDRLLWSEHVRDLRWVVSVTAWGVILMLAIVVYAFRANIVDSPVVPIGTLLAALGGVIAWCYKAGNARLGIVDLFACEIGTLCRICTIVGMADNCIAAYGSEAGQNQPGEGKQLAALREPYSHFASEEHYTPVFDANAKELQVLSVKTLTNITGFYTYWKATRDSFRRLSRTSSPDTPIETKERSWARGMVYLIYMQFLAFESARKAIRDLVEFEPNRAENTIVILLSELPAYHFLLKHFRPEDVQHVRLELRRQQYETAIADVYYATERAYGVTGRVGPPRKNSEELRRDWDKAYRLLPDLKRRYEIAFGQLPSWRGAGSPAAPVGQ